MNIKLYTKSDEQQIVDMMREEGDEWKSYWGDENREQHKTLLSNSITYVAYDGDQLCGYIRCRDDNGFGIYIYDLLVKKSYRGNNIGMSLMSKIRADYPNDTICAISDADGYYKKTGMIIGSVIEIRI